MQTEGIKQRLFSFTGILKDAGITVSTDELLTLFDSLRHIPFSDKRVFKQTLQSTLVKDYTDIPVFDQCFSEFFEQFSEFTTDEDYENPLSQDNLDRLQKLEEKLDDFLNERIENLFLEKEPEKLLALFIEEMIESEASGGGSIGMNLFVNKRSEIQAGYSQEQTDDEDEGEADIIRQHLLTQIKRRIHEETIGREIKEREDFLLNKYIYQLTPEEIKEMREVVRRFGQKLKNRISLRKKRVKHGGIDIKRTIRSSLKYDGVPFKIFYKNRKIDRPQLVVLCDISGSVNQYTRFMLLLTHTLQGLFSKVRTFAFISNMVEITGLFREMDPIRAINSIFGDTNFTYGWGSNYGRCFNQFIKEHSDSLNKKTTVLVLGDARNNNQDPGLDSFIKIQEKTRNIFWLNPDKHHLWDWSDSIASTYIPYTAEMKEVNSFIDLANFIDKLFTD